MTTWVARTVVSALLSAALASPLLAKTAIRDILAKGSEWTLNVDGEVGNLKLLGGRGKRTSDGGWETTMDVEWRGHAGTLRGWADGKNREQRVTLELTRRGGIRVALSGYIARETDAFMAGTSRYAAVPEDIGGAWFATRGGVSPTSRDDAPRDDPSPVADRPTTMTGELRVPAPIVEAARAEGPPTTCWIRGTITGERGHVGGVAVYTPDLRRRVQKADLAADGSYRLGPLPDGAYKVRPLARGKFELRSTPHSRDVTCGASQEHSVHFEILGISEG